MINDAQVKFDGFLIRDSQRAPLLGTLRIFPSGVENSSHFPERLSGRLANSHSSSRGLILYELRSLLIYGDDAISIVAFPIIIIEQFETIPKILIDFRYVFSKMIYFRIQNFLLYNQFFWLY